MAKYRFHGFELGNTQGEPSGGGETSASLGSTVGSGVSLDTGTVRTGARALKVVATSGAQSYVSIGCNPATGTSADSGAYARVYVRVTVRPSSTARIFWGSSTGASDVNLRLNPSGTVAFYRGSTLVGTSTTALTDTTKWYRLEVRFLDGTSVTVLQIDGNAEVTGSPSSWVLYQAYGAYDTVADTFTSFYDDPAWDGADFPGDSKVVCLRPISTNGTSAAKWTDNDGTQTNMYLGAAATPPAGIAANTTPSHAYIKHAGSAAGTTDKHDANMTTYTTAGIGAGDTVNAVLASIITGEESATGSKLVSFEVLSNPVIGTSGSVDVALTSGAQGTYPSGWWTKGAIRTNSPGALTLGTSPVMRVVRPETASRVASVAAMYMYVDYTPVVVAGPVWQAESHNTGTSTGFTATEPAGSTTNDVLVMQIVVADAHSAFSGPSGWTALPGSGQDCGAYHAYIYYIRRGESAPSLAVSWTSSVYFEWSIHRFSQCRTVADPVESSANGSTGAGASDPPSVTTLTANTLVLSLAWNWTGWSTVGDGAGYTLRFGAAGYDHGLGTKAVAVAGAENPPAWTNTGGFSDTWSNTIVLASVEPPAKAPPIYTHRPLRAYTRYR